MGTVYRRGDRWRAEVSRKGTRRSATFDTRREAIDWVATVEEEIAVGPVSRPTMRTAIDTYLREPGRSRWDTLRLTAVSRENWTRMPMRDVTPAVLSEWRDRRLTEVKPGTVLREITLLRSLFEAARRDWGWIERNPIADVRKPPRQPARERIVSDEERDEILRALGFDGERIETIQHETAVAFLLALETGMRAGELLSLTADLVDLERRVATLLKSKTGPGRRVPLSREAVRLFRLLLAKRMVRVRKLAVGRLFHVSSASLDVTFRRARKTAGLSGFTFHDARATAITRLARRLEPLELARMVGHSDLKSLLVYYRATAETIAARLD